MEEWIQAPPIERRPRPRPAAEEDWAEENRVFVRQEVQLSDTGLGEIEGHQVDISFNATNRASLADLEQDALSNDGMSYSASKGTDTFRTAPSAFSVATDGEIRISPRPRLGADNEHLTRARTTGIIQPKHQAFDWSGFGQHVQFATETEVPLNPLFEIARSGRAIVDAVQCRRIRLARKKMLTHRRFKPEEALSEVRLIQLLRHRHVVQCIGTYFQNKWIAILTYPVARCNLDEFLRETSAVHKYDERAMFNRQALVKFFACLSCALEYIHSEGVKHMDIKPQNILVNMNASAGAQLRKMDIYITDFGISRSVQDQDQSKTDGPTGRTEMYCSPEVAKEDLRGRSCDIFSLGCVFAEMATVVSGRTLEDFRSFRSDDGSSFYANLSLVWAWLDLLQNVTIYWDALWDPTSRDAIKGMLNEEPDLRPNASDLKLLFKPNLCCSLPQEPIQSG